jgi:hypothetical protein
MIMKLEKQRPGSKGAVEPVKKKIFGDEEPTDYEASVVQFSKISLLHLLG